MNHLLTKSCYSLLSGTMKPERIAQLAALENEKYAVLTDRNTMLASQAFFRACQKEGVQPVTGLIFDLQIEMERHPLLLLAQNTEGLQSLYALSTLLGTRNDPYITAAELSDYAKGTILFAGAADYVLESSAREQNSDACISYLQLLGDHHPKLYLALSLQEDPVWRKSGQYLESIAKTLGIECAAISCVEYEKPEDEQLLRLMQAILHQTTVLDPSLNVRKGRWRRNREEMEMFYSPELLEQTDRILESIEPYHIEPAKLPVFVNKAGVESSVYLTNLAKAGLHKRLQSIPDADVSVYRKRLEYELSVITSMGFEDYFLIVWDFIREARSRGIYVGPGRGSAAGSLAAYCLGISHVDPVKNGLLFERFLNPDRISMPDIDTDFPDDRRDEIIRYMEEKYGKGHASHIVTFARFKAKMALRDAARALGMPKEGAEQLCSMIVTKNGKSETLQQAYQNHPEFARAVDHSSSLKQLYETALSLEGYPRHYSVHAGGIVLSGDDIVHHAPLLKIDDQSLPVVQFEMDYLEELGLIKFDFLALKNLTVIDSVCTLAQKMGHPKINPLKLAADDPKVYALLSRAQTLGVFQLESDGIRDLLLRYKPRNFAEIADVIALYRPGPMQSIDSYLATRANIRNMKSVHPLLDELLSQTGGIFLYQEQIMQAAVTIGGFSLSQADTLRKAMSKKKRDVMESFSRQFIEGAAQKGIEKQKAQEIFSLMEKFAEYGYNKSHSYAYAMIVYQMAWLKANVPAAFYVCSLQQCLGAPGKTAQYISEMKAQSIPVLPVSVNDSTAAYTVEKEGIRIPLSAIKGIGKNAALKIVEEREKRGLFDDPAFALIRLLHAGVDARLCKILIRAGALECLGVSRETLLDEFDRIIGMEGILSWDEKSGCFMTPGMSAITLAPSAPRLMERLAYEKELFGFYLSVHPCQILRSRIRSLRPIAQVLPVLGNAAVCGIIQSVREHTTKNGAKMAFVQIEDDTGIIDLSVMPRDYERTRTMLAEGSVIEVTGRKDRPASILPQNMRFYDPKQLLESVHR